MNIFVLDQCPWQSAKYLCDKHVPKMLTESAQMLASALKTHNCPANLMPLNKSGKPYKGGYKNHPCTRWASKNRKNFMWLLDHALQIAIEHRNRFKTHHACITPVMDMCDLRKYIPLGRRTSFVQAMPDQYKVKGNAVKAYRDYYKGEKSAFAKWERTFKPEWY